MKISEYVKFQNNKAIIFIKVTPNSPKTEFFWFLWENILKIRAKWIPEKGKVNKEVISFLSKEFMVNKKNIVIISWETSQNKKIMIVQD